MLKYMAIVRKQGESASVKLMFAASNVAFALTEMRKLSGVKDLVQLQGYLLYELMEDGTYDLKAEKELEKKIKPEQKALPAPEAVKVHTTPIVMVDVEEKETCWAGYKVVEV